VPDCTSRQHLRTHTKTNAETDAETDAQTRIKRNASVPFNTPSLKARASYNFDVYVVHVMFFPFKVIRCKLLQLTQSISGRKNQCRPILFLCPFVPFCVHFVIDTGTVLDGLSQHSNVHLWSK
jgi:hypothetical protein